MSRRPKEDLATAENYLPEGEQLATSVATIEEPQRTKSSKRPRTAFYWIVGTNKHTDAVEMLSAQPTIGKASKFVATCHNLLHANHKDLLVLRCRLVNLDAYRRGDPSY